MELGRLAVILATFVAGMATGVFFYRTFLSWVFRNMN